MFRMTRVFSAASFAVVVCLSWGQPGAAFAAGVPYDKVFSNRNATGQELARAFFDLLSQTGSPTGVVGTTAAQDKASKALVKPYLDPAFVIQRASGERYTAQTYLPADVDDFQLGDVRVSRPADGILVVRYSISTFQTLSDAALVMSKDKAPRLTVFHWSAGDKRWKVLSHANFNTPIAAICDNKPFSDNGLKSPASPKDQALGEQLIGNFYDLIVKGDSLPTLHPELQFQSASGVGYTTLSERKKSTQYQRLTFDRALVTRNGRLLVVSSYTLAAQRTLMQDTALRDDRAANLATFMQVDDGRWLLIAMASFAPGKALPEGAVCVPAGKLQNAP